MGPESQAEPKPGTLAVGAVIVDSDGRVVLVRRRRPPSAGAWSLPGGRVEGDESLADAVVREAFEETSLRARVVCALGVVALEREGFRYSIHEHLLVPLAGTTLRAGDDAAEARWVQRAELLGLRVGKDAVAVIDRGLAEARMRGLAR